ncbi:MAG: GGDEF domain-containing protein [Ilumatobacteraceae bacterium]
MTAELESSPDRAAIEVAFERAPEPSSVVVVRIDDLPDDDLPGDGGHSTLVDQIGTRLRSIVREPVGVHDLGPQHLDGRPSEGHFLMILPGDRYTADAVAQRVVMALAAPFSVGGVDLTVRARAGIAEVAADDPVGAVRRADLAAHRSPRDTG